MKGCVEVIDFNENIMEQLFTNASKIARSRRIENPKEIKDDLTEEEAIKIYDELLTVIANHNVSYRNACRISVALANAFLTGAVELFGIEE